MSTTLTMRDALDQFLNAEEHRLSPEHGNMLGAALGQIWRYYRFLKIILDRHGEASERLKTAAKEIITVAPLGQHSLTEQEQKQMNIQSDLAQLEIESFYLFSKILLDKVARVIEFYFGKVEKKPLDSHDDLTKNLEQYARRKSLELPNNFWDLAQTLKKDVSDYRDYEIAHEKSPRTVKAGLFGGVGGVRIFSSRILPSDRDPKTESKPLPELLQRLETYLLSFLELMAMNRNKTGLKLSENNG